MLAVLFVTEKMFVIVGSGSVSRSHESRLQPPLFRPEPTQLSWPNAPALVQPRPKLVDDFERAVAYNEDLREAHLDERRWQADEGWRVAQNR